MYIHAVPKWEISQEKGCFRHMLLLWYLASNQTFTYKRVNFAGKYYLYTRSLIKGECGGMHAETYLINIWIGWILLLYPLQFQRSVLSVEMRTNQHGQTPVWIISGGILNESFSVLHLKVIPQTVAWTPGNVKPLSFQKHGWVHFPGAPLVCKRSIPDNTALWPHESSSHPQDN